MSGALLDTSILIATDLPAARLPPSAAISVVTLGELHAGVRLARTEQIRRLRQQRLQAVRAAFAPLPVDESVAEEYGRVLAVARRRRWTAKATDVLIVATAAAAERALYTLDGSQARLGREAGVEIVSL